MRFGKASITALTAVVTFGAGMLMPQAAETVTVVLHPEEESPFNGGVFQGWGTSIGWWGNRIGYSDELSQLAADTFYSEDGLSLDIVRYNVGGGDAPGHDHVTRSDSKMPCFAVPVVNSSGEFIRNANGDIEYTYNWDADFNQVNVLRKIKEQNNNVHIEGYTNSPPWFMTVSGCSGGGVNSTENLAPENYDIFAKFIADVTEHFAGERLAFDSYSPMNEPNPDNRFWSAYSHKQEGNPVALGAHQSGLITAVKNEFRSRNIATLVAGLDETSINQTITAYEKLSEDAKSALDRIDTHTYGGSKRSQLKNLAETAGKNLWMSEVDGSWNGFQLAERIILDMNGMQPSAWVMWNIIDVHKDAEFTDPNGKNTEKDGYVARRRPLWGVSMADHDKVELVLTNKYYAFGQFTKFINPGDTIIASSESTLAAYNKESGDIKIVALNSSDRDKQYIFDLSQFDRTGTTVREIRSNNLVDEEAEHWAEIKGEALLSGSQLSTTLRAGTITTYIIKGDMTGSDQNICSGLLSKF